MTPAERQRRYRAAQREKASAAAQEQADIRRTLQLLADFIIAGRGSYSEYRLRDPLRAPLAAGVWRLIEGQGGYALKAYREGSLGPDGMYALGALEKAARAHHEEEERKAAREEAERDKKDI